MAQGADIWAAEIILELKKAFPDEPIKLIAVIPYEEQASKWSDDYRERYYNILSQVDEEILLQHQYTKGCLHKRNRYLVDQSGHMIAVLDNSKGGTAYTVNYAIKNNLDVIIINPNEL